MGELVFFNPPFIVNSGALLELGWDSRVYIMYIIIVP